MQNVLLKLMSQEVLQTYLKVRSKVADARCADKDKKKFIWKAKSAERTVKKVVHSAAVKQDLYSYVFIMRENETKAAKEGDLFFLGGGGWIQK